MVERARTITDLYHAALELPPEQRASFLHEACDGDAGLRREIESLLEFAAPSGEFLETPAAVHVGAAFSASPDVMVGRTLGPYTILAALGAGGMGEVYRARDEQLGRDVAIKLLPQHLGDDPERRARLAREARVLAAFRHPHIGAIHGLVEADGVTALVLELVEGPTLAAKLEEGPLSVRLSLRVARQVAAALEAAHDAGIVHRDVKPANIVIQGSAASNPFSDDLDIKVLDFGVAKASAVAGLEPSLWRQGDSPPTTIAGRIIGTPAYMSPEQARGQAVDTRTDIWAFGCVLFEMLSGRRPFGGDSVPETFGRILERDPDWSLLPPSLPAVVLTLLRRCLRKDPQKRLRDAAAIRIELEDLERDSADATVLTASRRMVPARTLLALALLSAASIAIAIYLPRRSPVQAERIEFEIGPPAGGQFTGPAPEFAISPDGRHLAIAATVDGVLKLWVRSFESAVLRPLPGTEGARSPFWKPDSLALGFFANHQLKTVNVNGGSPVVICPVEHWEDAAVVGGAWSARDVIVFGRADEPLSRVSTSQPGQTAARLTELEANDVAHRWPFFLPDGDHFLFIAQTTGLGELRVGSLSSSTAVSLGTFDSHAVYAAGRLYFVRGGNLTAQRFDTRTMRPSGDAHQLGIAVGVEPLYHRGIFAVSTSGQLVYRPVARPPRRLTWLDRKGVPQGVVGLPGTFSNLDISPDDQRAAVSRLTAPPGAKVAIDIWTIDLTTGDDKRLTDDPGWEHDPAWSADGALIAFNSNRPNAPKTPYALYIRAADGSGQDRLVTTPAANPGIMSPDWFPGGLLAYESRGPDGTDLWTVSPSGKPVATALFPTRHDDEDPAFSRNGKWLAYASNATGQPEIYVRPFPRSETAMKISRQGGVLPRWRGDGRELFFLSLDGHMMAATLDLEGRPVTPPSPLFQTPLRPGHNRAYDVTRDGERFLLPISEPGAPLTVVLNGSLPSGR